MSKQIGLFLMKKHDNNLLKAFRTADPILPGQVTFKLFTKYWPKPVSSKENPAELVDFMNNFRKIFFYHAWKMWSRIIRIG
jgi:hypothetical protein